MTLSLFKRQIKSILDLVPTDTCILSIFYALSRFTFQAYAELSSLIDAHDVLHDTEYPSIYDVMHQVSVKFGI